VERWGEGGVDEVVEEIEVRGRGEAAEDGRKWAGELKVGEVEG
jgi:hypothetical protein